MLRVETFHTHTQKTEEVHVRTSPARIGRSGLSDIMLDEPSVSNHHAVLMFDEDGIWFSDNGSSNGSLLEGQPVVPHTQVPVTSGAVLDVGPVQLKVFRGGEARFERRRPLETQVSDELLTLMTQVDVTAHMSTRSDVDGSANGGSETAETAVPQSVIAQLHYLRAVMAAVEPARSAYFAALEEQIASLPTAQRAHIVSQLAREYPELSMSTDFAEIARRAGVRDDAYTEPPLAEWVLAMGGVSQVGSEGEQVSNARVLARVAMLLQTFSQALFELRRARQQGVRELGLGDPVEQWPTRGQDIVSWLLDFRVDGEERVAALLHEFADVAVHQVGLVSAMREGMRAVVEELAPTVVTRRCEGQRRKRRSPLDLLPVMKSQLWDAFRAAHADLTDAERYARVAFGPRFAKAYLSMVGRRIPSHASALPAVVAARQTPLDPCGA